ncbi:MAG: SDR family oxidoreductase [Chitinophagia bacterium]|nr:SDR family oxidoreductase [Chitinophagia bacterium]
MVKEKVIIVTGGSGLLGTEMVKDLQNKGAYVINFDINQDTDVQNGFVNCDITDSQSVDAALDAVVSHYGRIDGLVNNAYPRTKDWGTPFEEIQFASWKANVDMQLNSMFYISQQVLKGMKERKSGNIVNIASIYGVVGNDWTVYEGTSIVSPAAYAAIKGGVINFTRYLAALYGKDGIRINCVSPGGIFNNQSEPFVRAYEKKVPMQRLGKPDDIAPAVSFLLSDEAEYITGQNLIVDGGWTAI